MLALDYYGRSICLVALLGFGGLGCASASSVAAASPVIRYASLSDPKPPSFAGRPVVLAFVAGDRLPIDFDLDSSLVKTRAPSRIELEVTRPFFMLIRPDGPPKISVDGKDFDSYPKGYFRAGLGVEKETGAHGTVTIGFLPYARAK